MSDIVAIAGMGWLGKPFAQHLMNLGFRVKGSVTSVEKASQLNKRGFDVYPVQLAEEGVKGEPQAFLKNCSVLVILIPPGLRGNTGSDYVLKMSHFLSEVKAAALERVILVSSTSVYDDSQGTVTEKDIPRPQTDAGKQLFQVEQLFFNAPKLQTTIVRFGGLLGGSRQPVRYLAGRKNLRNGKAPVNLIHRQDCIHILSKIILQDAFGHIFNAVHPDHPTKETYYTEVAKQLNLEPPSYLDTDSEATYKKVNSVRLKTLLKFQFTTPI